MLDFLKKEEEEQIIEAIRAAELNTSGEIRVHLHKDINKGLMKDAALAFKKMGMHKTHARNGVLLFIVPEAKQFAILGDKGINKRVDANYWDEVKDIIQQHFRTGQFAEGICRGIEKVGEQLKTLFPYQSDDVNELSDDISYGS